MRIRVCRYKNAGVAGYAEAFRPVQSDSQTSEWYSYFENDVLVFSGFLYYNEDQKEIIISKYYYSFLPENQIIFHELGNSGRDVLILL